MVVVVRNHPYQDSRAIRVAHPELALEDGPVSPKPGSLSMRNSVVKIALVF